VSEVKPIVVESCASKLFRVLVVGGLSMASTAACSSSSPPGDADAAATGDAKGAMDDAAKDVESQEDASDSAPIPDVVTDSCVPYDGRWDGPDGGFCAHGVCAW
jgi:hypothetical protein